MTTPEFYISAESKVLAKADFGERERDTREDHYAHAPGRACRACGQIIERGQPARRRGESDWVHDVCPPELGARAPSEDPPPGGRSG